MVNRDLEILGITEVPYDSNDPVLYKCEPEDELWKIIEANDNTLTYRVVGESSELPDDIETIDELIEADIDISRNEEVFIPTLVDFYGEDSFTQWESHMSDPMEPETMKHLVRLVEDGKLVDRNELAARYNIPDRLGIEVSEEDLREIRLAVQTHGSERGLERLSQQQGDVFAAEDQLPSDIFEGAENPDEIRRRISAYIPVID